MTAEPGTLCRMRSRLHVSCGYSMPDLRRSAEPVRVLAFNSDARVTRFGTRLRLRCGGAGFVDSHAGGRDADGAQSAGTRCCACSPRGQRASGGVFSGVKRARVDGNNIPSHGLPLNVMSITYSDSYDEQIDSKCLPASIRSPDHRALWMVECHAPGLSPACARARATGPVGSRISLLLAPELGQ
jgi:hypothetical protein